MRLYLEVAVRAFRRAAAYRTAFLAGMVTNAFFGAMLTAIYTAAYAGRPSVAGYTPQDAITYLWAGQAMISLGGAWLSQDMTRAIRSGDVAVDLMRPWNYYAYWASQQLGERFFNLLLRGALTYLAGALLFGARLPAPDVLPGLLASLALALACSCALSYIVNASAFWMLDNSGVLTIASIVQMFLSGFLIPLAFMPPWLAGLARALPFQAITGLPIETFLGRLQGEALWRSLALQLAWAAALTLAALGVTRAAMRKLVIQGG